MSGSKCTTAVSATPYTEALPDEKAVTAIGFMQRARAWFTAHGITHIHRIVTDQRCLPLGQGLRPRAAGRSTSVHRSLHPLHKGKVERYHPILGEEFVNARTWTSETQRAEALKVWNIHFNYHRPHSAGAGQPQPRDSPPASPISWPHEASDSTDSHRTRPSMRFLRIPVLPGIFATEPALCTVSPIKQGQAGLGIQELVQQHRCTQLAERVTIVRAVES